MHAIHSKKCERRERRREAGEDPAGEPATDETYTVDNDAPGLTSFARQTPATSPTNADTLVFRATFDEDVPPGTKVR